MTLRVDVAQLPAAQAGEAGDVLARAFFDDPAWLWAVPADGGRKRVLSWFFRAAVSYGLLRGEVLATKGKVEGAVILLPPDRPRLEARHLARVGLWQMAFRAGAGAFWRFLTLWRTLEERHRLDVPPRHWYVWLLGVDPPWQGQGVGSQILRPLVSRADDDSLPCYLDTTRARNLAFYRRHGFQVVYEGDVPRGGPHLWTLVREPG